MVGPSIHTTKKSRWNPSAVGNSIMNALENSRGNAGAMAVFHQGHIVGLVRGTSDRTRAKYTPVTPSEWRNFATYDDLNTASKNGKEAWVIFNLTGSTWTSGMTWNDMWTVQGTSLGGQYTGGANTARLLDNTTQGAFNLNQRLPGAGETRHFAQWDIGHISGSGTCIRSYILYDRVLTYDNCSVTTSTSTMTNTSTAARYISSGQEGMQISVTACGTALGATAANLSSMTVTDNAGNTAVSMAPGYTMAWYTSGPLGSSSSGAPIVLPRDNANGFSFTPWLPLPGGVSGVRKIEAFTSSAINTGAVCLALVKPVGTMWNSGTGITSHLDLTRALYTLERIYDTACLNLLMHQASSNTSNTLGRLRLVHTS